MDIEEQKRLRGAMTGAEFARYCLEDERAIPPSSKTLGCRPLSLDPERGFGRLEYNPGPETTNPIGGVQGGFIAAMLDDTMALCALTAIGGGYVLPTLEMKVTYLRPVKAGCVLAEGWLVHRGKSVAFLEGRLLDAEEKEIARATATAMIRAFV